MKALALGTKHLYLIEPLSKQLESVLDKIYDSYDLSAPLEANLNKSTAIIKEFYETVNS